MINPIVFEDHKGNYLNPRTHAQNVYTGKSTETVEQALNKQAAEKVGKKSSGGGEIFNDTTNNTATGLNSHAQNQDCHAIGDNSDAGGFLNTVNAYSGFSRGFSNTIDGMYTAGIGEGLVSQSSAYAQTLLGKYNTPNVDGLLIVGYGTEAGATANALRVSSTGRCYGAQAFGSSGADYAEMFEWADGNPNGEDRRGLFVTLDGEKISLAHGETDYIVGIISAYPSVVGDVCSDEWQGKFKKDVFGAYIWEEIKVEEKDLGNGSVIPAHTEKRRVLNPDYDPSQEYKSRDERKEWATVGMLGKLVVIDDGTCEVNGYCKPSKNGIATASSEKTSYRVIGRIDENHIKVLVR